LLKKSRKEGNLFYGYKDHRILQKLSISCWISSNHSQLKEFMMRSPITELIVLGINFSQNLDWTKQTLVAIGKVNGYIRGLQTIKKSLTKEIALKLITAFYFSMVYYGSVVWMTPDLKYKNWRLLEAAHYRVMMPAIQDYSRSLMREKIDEQCNWATPREWAAYDSSSMAIKVVEKETPRWLNSDLRSTLYMNDRRRPRSTFLDRSRTKIGKQCFKNRLNSIFKCINFDWFGLKP